MHVVYFDEVKYAQGKQNYYWLGGIVASAEAIWNLELLPASQTPSLGVMMKPEVANGNETDVQSGVQA
ncbi:MAG TPA: hypothetical protein VJL61_02465 [Rhodanobacteraceae bacterium]|nr:hypothetical protein [Rhodanobacteraceae bacterium]